VGDPAGLSDEELVEMTRLTYTCVGLLGKAVRAQGFNIGTNIGQCAGAGLPDHLHVHVVPRWSGDTNYMAVLGGVRVVPDGLNAAYDQLVSTAAQMGLRDS
jgi:ATP adenylyltransferase